MFKSRLFLVAAALLFMLVLCGTQEVQAQWVSHSITMGGWNQTINPADHNGYYLPYYDRDRVAWDYLYSCFWGGDCRARRYAGSYWYPWTFRWGRYDVPNNSWWTFGEGFVDEYGTGSIWTAGEPTMTTELKAIQTVEREIQTKRATREATRITQRRAVGSSGISMGRGSSSGSSGGGSSIGSSGGGSSVGSSGGGGGRSGKK